MKEKYIDLLESKIAVLNDELVQLRAAAAVLLAKMNLNKHTIQDGLRLSKLLEGHIVGDTGKLFDEYYRKESSDGK